MKDSKKPVFVNVYVAQESGEESIQPGWVSIPGLFKRSTNTGSGKFRTVQLVVWGLKKLTIISAQQEDSYVDLTRNLTFGNINIVTQYVNNRYQV